MLENVKNKGYNHIEFLGNLIEITLEQLASFIDTPIALTEGETDLVNGKVHTDLDLKSLIYAFSKQYETISTYVKIGDDIYPLKLQSMPNDIDNNTNTYWEINTLNSTLVKVTIIGDNRDGVEPNVTIELNAVGS